MGKGRLRSTKRLCKIQSGSLIGSYTRHMCFPSGPVTSKSSRHVRRITRPRCSGFCCVIWLSISFSCWASSALLLLIIFRATVCSDCHLSLNFEDKDQFLGGQHDTGKRGYGGGYRYLEMSRASHTVDCDPQPILTSSWKFLASTSPGFAG